ncbi:MraY family glycosyltransferase [Taibaiella soli]|uniref:Undecaprenyl/decaprenyl-phosphate alpha-N-acetylglucosaminyl 1-phosphate transferase n=1 Tax=Taibaiella soli TaxID=1649169 RepID=A0A2W2AMX7_9BACT|nr:MraY family glycosyltransferase [Taibaiella soli]PZF73680.1 undecaprenyl/decaprenyl-phosphate alpha-N-acetylglucosaminyl 1-phosphate transferase [Taibaiella soli]
MTSLPPYVIYIFSFVSALILSMMSIPRIIYIAKRKKLFDVPDNNRKIHSRIIPNFGGVAIFFGFIIISSLTVDTSKFLKWNYIAASALILFVTGVKDDLLNLPPLKKIVAQFAAAAITVFFADIRLSSLHGLLGIYELPYLPSAIFSILGCMFVTNAFNLIDGIDGLAGTIGVLSCLMLGIGLGLEGNTSGACIAFSLMGGIVGFLRYNIAPAKIFMGDTGSLLIGFTISVLSIMFINSYHGHGEFAGVVHSPKAVLLVALAILSIPVFDTFRVFTTRSMKGRSPFRADKTHLHHYLLDLGLSHSSAVSVLFTANVLIILVSFFVQDYNMNLAVASLSFVAFGLFAILFVMRRKMVNKVSGPQPGKIGKPEIQISDPSQISRNTTVNLNGPITLKGNKLNLEESAPAEILQDGTNA